MNFIARVAQSAVGARKQLHSDERPFLSALIQHYRHRAVALHFPLKGLPSVCDRGEARSRATANPMRITADLIQSSRAFYNPLRERELDLRGTRARHARDGCLWGGVRVVDHPDVNSRRATQ